MKLRYTDRISLRLEKNTASVMAGLLHDGESENDFIRCGIKLEITARQAAALLQPTSARMHGAMVRVNAYIADEREAGRDVPLGDDGIRRLLAVAWPGIEI